MIFSADTSLPPLHVLVSCIVRFLGKASPFSETSVSLEDQHSAALCRWGWGGESHGQDLFGQEKSLLTGDPVKPEIPPLGSIQGLSAATPLAGAARGPLCGRSHWPHEGYTDPSQQKMVTLSGRPLSSSAASAHWPKAFLSERLAADRGSDTATGGHPKQHFWLQLELSFLDPHQGGKSFPVNGWIAGSRLPMSASLYPSVIMVCLT